VRQEIIKSLFYKQEYAFMLRSMRDGAKSGFLKFILLGFMALAVGGLVLTDVGGFFRGGISSNVVAKGDGFEIGLVEFDRSLRRVLARQGMGPDEAYRLGLIDQVLRSEIQSRILAREARRIGINPNEEVLRAEMVKLADSLPADENMTKSQALGQVLRSQGISEEQFVAALRTEIGINLLSRAIVGGLTTLPREQATALYQYQNEQRDFRGIYLQNASVSDLEGPTDENLQNFYDARKTSFAIPETRNITIVTLSRDMLAESIEISEDELREFYDNNMDLFEHGEKRTIQQAILPSQEEAQNVLNTITQTGQALENAVETVTGSASAYLGENSYEAASLPEELATPVFEAEVNTLIGPVQSALGWHVVTVKNITPPETDSFDSVKEDIQNEIMQTRLVDEMVMAANALDDQLASGEELSVIVNEMGLTTESFEDITQAGTSRGGEDRLGGYQGDRAQILEAAFDYETGEVSPVMEMADGRYVAVRVDAVTPSSYQPFEEVQNALREQWMEEQRRLSAQARAEEAFNALREGTALEEIAAQYNAQVEDYSDLQRANAPGNEITLPALRQIFDANPQVPLQVSVTDGYIIGQVTDITLPGTEGAEEEIAQIQEQNSSFLPQEFIEQYINTLAARYDVKTNEQLLRQTYGAAAQM
jgi:peptidyl-prolyl cis-trans isomerase D